MKKRIVIGISGASGAVYAQRTVSHLLELGHEVHVVASPSGVRLLVDELGADGFDLRLLGGLPADADPAERGLIKHNIRDVGAVIASGSFQHDGMAIVPASSHTLNAVAAGLGDNLLVRAAAVTLKERRRLVILHRESPLTLMDIRAMETITLAGGIVAPASPGFYLLPKTIGEIVDFMVARVLDLLHVEHRLGQRWEGETPRGQ
jgi:4-hydroxy-3-polyprenylbenzoate decarboxylase